ncbi:MAG: tetratricopeptide repeat protein [Desulfomonile tiedjei]|uniref:Tetratricopeptide repeat protein n=1 Tax=Desulfomonile tiedjei TaxID=2358 RepID=A0A9D6V4F8_9BACT|nr:tetratricopeptide repeat protein [Desulfomonile tiedjei]
MDKGNIEQASQVWEKVFADPVYGPVAQVLLARAKQSAGDFTGSEKILKEFSKNHPNGPYSELARQALADLLCKRDSPEAIPLLEKMSARATEKNKTALMLRQADLQRNLGNYSAAANHYRTLFLNYPASVEGLKAGDALDLMAYQGKIPRPSYSENDQLARADRLFKKGRFDLAADVYQALLKTKPGNKSMMLKLARCRYKDRQNEKAISLLKEILNGKLSDQDRNEAMHMLSLVYWRLDRDKDFESCSNQLIEKAPLKLKRRAVANLAAYNFEKKRYAQAETYYKRLLESDPEGTVKVDVRWKMAWIKYWNRKYAEAADDFKETRQLSPARRIENASKYWQARSLMMAGRASDAEPILKELARNSALEYYGQEAADLLASNGTPPDNSNGSLRAFPDTSLSPVQISDQYVSAALMLMDKGLPEFALLNLEAVPKAQRTTPSIAFLMAKAALGAGKHHEAREILVSAFGGLVENPPENAPPEFIEMAFPRIHFAETVKHSEKHAVDPHLVWAVIRQESAYDPASVSPAGALGLMQVTPAAAGLSRAKGKIPAGAIQEILDPRQNIAHGIRILSKNIKTFKGKVVPAVASYNADVKKVRGWLRSNDKMKQDEFIDNIPYLETRMYVKRVLAGYRAYSRLHMKKDLSGFW